MLLGSFLNLVFVGLPSLTSITVDGDSSAVYCLSSMVLEGECILELLVVPLMHCVVCVSGSECRDFLR